MLVWAYNDTLRDDLPEFDLFCSSEDLTDDARAFNDTLLSVLTDTLGERDDEVLLKAELLRESRRFAECISVLDQHPQPSGFMAALAKQVRKHAEEADSKVFEIIQTDEEEECTENRTEPTENRTERTENTSFCVRVKKVLHDFNSRLTSLCRA